MSQVASPHLSASTHDHTHGDLDLTDGVVVAATITVYHDKLHLLLLLEVVWHGEASLEVWIQIVLLLLGLANLSPLAASLFKEKALWVRLAESVEVAELASGHKEVHLHGQVLLWHHHILTSRLGVFICLR